MKDLSQKGGYTRRPSPEVPVGQDDTSFIDNPLTPVAACANAPGITKRMIGLGIAKYGIDPVQFK